MKLYIDYAAAIYGIYLNYISKEDIHVYSIDEAFNFLNQYKGKSWNIHLNNRKYVLI